jgi:hypothetical protein
LIDATKRVDLFSTSFQTDPKVDKPYSKLQSNRLQWKYRQFSIDGPDAFTSSDGIDLTRNELHRYVSGAFKIAPSDLLPSFLRFKDL